MSGSKLTVVPAGTPELRLGISGKAMKVRPVLTQPNREGKGGGNLVWGVIRPGKDKLEFGGIPVKALADSLPTEVTVYNPETKDSIVLSLVDGPTEYTDKKTGVTSKSSPSKVYAAEHQLPGLEVSRVLNVKVTARKDGLWNVKVSFTNAGGGSSAPVEDIFAEDDLYA